MKLNKLLIGGVAALMTLTSCSDWLDVNVDPNNPSDQFAEYHKRLAHIEFYTNHAYFIATQVSTPVCGYMLNGLSGNNYRNYNEWAMNEGRSTTCYQWWYVGAACNLSQTIQSAEAAGAWHYAGAAYLIQAYGFALMNDLHGELPYSDALGENTLPTYDTGKEMFVRTIEDIDKGIEYLKRTQENGAVALSANDFWGNGDVNKWIKFGYLLKARQLNHLIKKGAGKWDPENGQYKYDADLILECLNNAATSNAESMVIYHTEGTSATNDNLGWAEPIDWSPLHSIIGTNSRYFYTKALLDNLTNFDGKGIEDPRADRIFPWARSMKTSSTPASIKWSADGKWRRSMGVDTHTPHSSTWDYATYGDKATAFGGLRGYNHFFIDNANADNAGDTMYIHLRTESQGRAGAGSLFFSQGSDKEASRLSGNYYTHASSPSLVGCYHEVCFIRAEILFNKGDKAGAYAAYKAGVKAHMELMNTKLNEWQSDAEVASSGCPAFAPMTQAEIDNYCNTALGTSGDITLGKIMTQKSLAMMHTMEIWNDFRKYDYDKNVFYNFERAANWATNAAAQNAVPEGKFPRRLRNSSHEYNYNADNYQAIGEKVPGANVNYEGGWYKALDMWTIPIWWDSTQE